MNHSKEIGQHPIRKSIKYRVRCTRLNKINDNIGRISKEQTLCRSNSPLKKKGKMDLNLT